MRTKLLKKMLAGTLALALMLSTGVMAFAVTGTATGTGNDTGDGTFEGSVDSDVIAVTLPTVVENTLDYIADPEGLIAATEKAKYPDMTFQENANVFFKISDTEYKNESAKYKVVNKGTVDVDITVEAEATETDDVTMATAVSKAAWGTKATEAEEAVEVYLGLKVGTQAEAVIGNSSAPAEVVVGLKGKPDNYEIQYDSEAQKYEHAAKAGVPETAWNYAEVGIVSGACNSHADWSTEGLTVPQVKLTWSYAQRTAETAPMEAENATNDKAPSATSDLACLTAGTDAVINIDLGAGDDEATAVTAANWGGSNFLGQTVTWDGEAKTITVDKGTVDYFLANPGNTTITLVFDGDESKTLDLTLTPASN